MYIFFIVYLFCGIFTTRRDSCGSGEDGAGVSATLIGGGSYYLLTEIYPTETLKLMNSKIGKARLYAKWTEFLTIGVVPGTSISDGLHLIE